MKPMVLQTDYYHGLGVLEADREMRFHMKVIYWEVFLENPLGSGMGKWKVTSWPSLPLTKTFLGCRTSVLKPVQSWANQGRWSPQLRGEGMETSQNVLPTRSHRILAPILRAKGLGIYTTPSLSCWGRAMPPISRHYWFLTQAKWVW